MKKLVIIGANDFQNQLILKAKSLGYETHVFAWEEGAVGKDTADYFYPVSIIEKENILEVCKNIKPDGVCSIASDLASITVNYVAEKLGLPCNRIEDTLMQTNKYAMRTALSKAGIPCPKFVLVKENFDKSVLDEFNYPIIVKPTDRSGSRNIMKLDSINGVETAVKEACQTSFEHKAIIEEYIYGDEYSIETISYKGEHHYLATTKKYTTGAPHFVEIGHSQPSRFPKEDVEEIKDLAGRAALAVGIKNGPAHAEIILTKNGPKMVEIGARMGGGCITTHLVPLSTGISMTKATIQTALGEPTDIEQKFEKGSAIRFIIPPIGKVKSISGKEEAERIPGIQLVEIQCKVGQVLGELENGTCRIGYVIAQGETAEEAVEICERALAMIQIEVC